MYFSVLRAHRQIKRKILANKRGAETLAKLNIRIIGDRGQNVMVVVEVEEVVHRFVALRVSNKLRFSVAIQSSCEASHSMLST